MGYIKGLGSRFPGPMQFQGYMRGPHQGPKGPCSNSKASEGPCWDGQKHHLGVGFSYFGPAKDVQKHCRLQKNCVPAPGR